MKYLLTTRYLDGMVSRFEFFTEELLVELRERVENNDKHGNVASWKVEAV